MRPEHFDGADMVFGPPSNWNNFMHGPCMVLPVMRRDGMCISRWAPSWRERLLILLGRRVYLRVASGKTQPPVALTLNGPELKVKKPDAISLESYSYRS